MPGQPERARRIMNEVCLTAEMRGFPLPMDLVEEQMQRTSLMGDFIPSSAVDYLRGRPVSMTPSGARHWPAPARSRPRFPNGRSSPPRSAGA